MVVLKEKNILLFWVVLFGLIGEEIYYFLVGNEFGSNLLGIVMETIVVLPFFYNIGLYGDITIA